MQNREPALERRCGGEEAGEENEGYAGEGEGEGGLPGSEEKWEEQG